MIVFVVIFVVDVVVVVVVSAVAAVLIVVVIMVVFVVEFCTCEPIFKGISTLLYSSASVTMVLRERRIHSRSPAAVASQTRQSAMGKPVSFITSTTISFNNLCSCVFPDPEPCS